MDLPIENSDFHSYVSLPEGICFWIYQHCRGSFCDPRLQVEDRLLPSSNHRDQLVLLTSIKIHPTFTKKHMFTSTKHWFLVNSLMIIGSIYWFETKNLFKTHWLLRFNPSEQHVNMNHWGLLSHVGLKIKNNWNHQPDWTSSEHHENPHI